MAVTSEVTDNVSAFQNLADFKGTHSVLYFFCQCKLTFYGVFNFIFNYCVFPKAKDRHVKLNNNRN